FDTWVYSGILGEDEIMGTDLDPVVGNVISKIESSDTKQAAELTATAQPENLAVEGKVDEKSSPSLEVPEGSKKFLFKIFTSEKNLNGDVDILDLDRKSRRVASYRGNEEVLVKSINK